MEGKKVLILTYYWPPAGGVAVQRWLKFATRLKGRGWEPVIFTARDPDYPSVNPDLLSQVPNDLEIHHIPVPEPRKWIRKFIGKKVKSNQTHQGSTDLDGLFYKPREQRTWKQNLVMWVRANWFIPDARVLWVPGCVRYLSSYIKEYGGDYLITTGPPHSVHLTGLQIQKKTPICWLSDFRDPWTDIEYFDFLPLTRRSEQKHKDLERKVISAADGFITVSPSWMDRFNALRTGPSIVLTNGYDAGDFPKAQTKAPELFTISHIGTLQGDRLPTELLVACSAWLKQYPEWRSQVCIRFAGPSDNRLEELVRQYGLEDITRISGFIRHSEAIELMMESGLLLLLINRVRRNEMGRIPAKLFEYLYSRRPILLLGPAEGDAAEILRQTHGGYISEWKDTDRIREILTNSFQSFKQGQYIQESSGIEHYSRDYLTTRLITFMEQVKSTTV